MHHRGICSERRNVMRNTSKTFSIIWKLALIACAIYGLLDGSGILAGSYKEGFPHMFTNVSNIFALGYFSCAAVWLTKNINDDAAITLAPTAKYTVTISLLVTMLIAHFMLFDAMFQDGDLVFHLVVLHYIVPLMALLDWALFDVKGKLPIWGPFAWLSLVAAYLAFTMIAVGVFGIYMGGGTTADISMYPYTFLDPGISGVEGVVGFCGAMLVAFIVLGYVLWAIDRLLGRLARKH